MDSYIIFKGAITATGYKAVIFRNYSLVINCITETNKSQIDESLELDLNISNV